MPRLTRRILVIAAFALIAGALAATFPGSDALTAYCNNKRGSAEVKLVKQQCNCSKKHLKNPNFDVASCLNTVPTGVVPKFIDGLAKIYFKVRILFAPTYSNPSCQDESGFSTVALDAAARTVIACCQNLAAYQSCVQAGAF